MKLSFVSLDAPGIVWPERGIRFRFGRWDVQISWAATWNWLTVFFPHLLGGVKMLWVRTGYFFITIQTYEVLTR